MKEAKEIIERAIESLNEVYTRFRKEVFYSLLGKFAFYEPDSVGTFAVNCLFSLNQAEGRLSLEDILPIASFNFMLQNTIKVTVLLQDLPFVWYSR